MNDVRPNIAMLVALALLFSQGAGLHLHVHQHGSQHSEQHSAEAQHSPHLASSDMHADAHADDGDVDINSYGLTKSSYAKNLVGLAASVALTLRSAASGTLGLQSRFVVRSSGLSRNLRPPLRGPPA